MYSSRKFIVEYCLNQLTAGKAKNDMAKTAKQEATILPIHVCGTLSP